MEVIGYLSDEQESVPVQGLVIHQAGPIYLATEHDIVCDDAGAPVFTEGRLLTHDAMRDMMQRLLGGMAVRAVLPSPVLVADPDLLVWWHAPERRPIFFHTSDDAYNAEMSGQAVLHPPLLFIGRPGKLSIFALPANERPGMTTELCRAPYLNVWASGSMCEGNVPMPPTTRPTHDTIEEYHRAFFDSHFVHTNLGRSQLINWPGGHNAYWRAMRTRKTVPYQALIPLTERGQAVTLARVINETETSRLFIDVADLSAAAETSDNDPQEATQPRRGRRDLRVTGGRGR